MIVPSPNFLAFSLGAGVVYHLGRGATWRRCVLLVANVAFLVSFSSQWFALLPFAGFLVLGYIFQETCRVGSLRSPLFAAIVCLTLFMFFLLKRYSFIPQTLYLNFPYFTVGLSYVFFRMLHIIIDAHQGEFDHRIDFLSYLNYTLNFTSLTSGPIQRYQDYHRMEATPLPVDWVAAGVAIERIVLGYFKVAVVSTILNKIQIDQIEELTATLPFDERVTGLALTVAIYPLYLYFNFSGYVDVVIGVARFFGIVLPENFNRPFSSENFMKFWSKWHITLSEWLKTYVYNPIMIAGMGRFTSTSFAPYLTVFAFFVTFFLVGLWHGQTNEFMFFGVLQGGGVAINKLYQIAVEARLGRKGYQALAENPFYTTICRGLTFVWFAFTLLWFWSTNTEILKLAVIGGAGGTAAALIATFLAATVILALWEWALRLGKNALQGEASLLSSRYVRTVISTSLVVFILGAAIALDMPAPDIVYKNF